MLLVNYEKGRQNHRQLNANIIDRCSHAAYTRHSVIYLSHSHKGAFK